MSLQDQYDNQVASWTFLGLTIIAVYDTLITLHREIEFVWSAPLSSVNVLFICLRYGNTFVNVLYALTIYLRGLSTQTCYALIDVSNVAAVMVNMSAALILAVQTQALYSTNSLACKFVKGVVVVNTAFIASSVLVMVITSKFTGMSNGSCFEQMEYTPAAAICVMLMYVHLAWYDLTIFVMTSIKCVKLLRAKRTKLVWRIFQNSLMYYIVLTALTLTNLIANGTISRTRPALITILPTLVRVSRSVFVSRILLNLRQAASRMSDASALAQDLSDYELRGWCEAVQQPEPHDHSAESEHRT